MGFVAIVKQAKDVNRKLSKGFPPEYPLLCVECETLEEALRYSSLAMSTDEYRAWHSELCERFPVKKNKKRSWWKFWGAA